MHNIKTIINSQDEFLNQCNFEKNNYVIITNATINCKIYIDEPVTYIWLQDCTFNETVSFNCNIIRPCQISKTNFHSGICIKGKSNDELKFIDCSIQSLFLQNFTFNGKLTLWILKIDMIWLLDNEFYKEAQIGGIKGIKSNELESFTIENCKFTKPFYLENCDSNKFILKGSIFEYPVNLSNSNFNNLYITLTHFISILVIDNLDIKKATRNVYCQLKNEMLKANNRIDALTFHAKEMEAHTLELKKNGQYWFAKNNSKSYWNKKAARLCTKEKSWAISVILILKFINLITHPCRVIKFNQDLFVLRVNQITNKHGSDWKRGITFTLSVSAIFFILFWFSLKSKPVEFNFFSSWTQTKDDLGAIFSYFAQFTNPTHWTSFMPDEYKGSWSVFIDIASRLFIGVGFYQTIQAFRKYGRF